MNHQQGGRLDEVAQEAFARELVGTLQQAQAGADVRRSLARARHQALQPHGGSIRQEVLSWAQQHRAVAMVFSFLLLLSLAFGVWRTQAGVFNDSSDPQLIAQVVDEVLLDSFEDDGAL
ncbi:hypothetical protein [Chitinibacter sp. GC72]|uniref:hypothetical protein n=1 Tax=Chitinibacter sp. GC72 TaxID=1526917 RepID=UPI0012FB6D39|nr:hypothetical protein [Chitinibacter sp. GC72]